MWTEVSEATYLDGYRISILFNNGIRKVVDFKNITRRYPVFKPLCNLNLFKQFKVTDTLEWEDGKIDLASGYLYGNGAMA